VDFCFNCGTTLPHGYSTCPKCGASINSKSKSKSGILSTIFGSVFSLILGVAIVAGSVVLSNGTGAYRPEKIAEKYINACFVDFDAERAMELYYPRYIDDRFEMNDIVLEDQIDFFQEQLDTRKQEMEDVDGSIKYDLIDIDEVDGDELEEIEERYDEFDINIDDVKLVECEITAYEDGDEIDAQDWDFIVVRIGVKWYLDSSTVYSND